jgi:hypothetical protein
MTSSVVNYSDKLVGHKSLGGSWNLNTFSNESVSNKIIPFNVNSLPFSSEVINNWEHTLAITISAGQVAALIVIAKVCSQLLITSEEKGREFTLNGIILLETDSLLKVFKFQEPPSDL